ncbi:unnamed protein product [Brachionus calyciflorus]|uniref:Arrestin C-terminal-like domain-containing protein n=1 Tax=Brachionus calyciflorus TaxID=104777 RepID=A0A813WJJ2_9BILA|nr:unnamed protein product [Brachionus calyciflorus]
MEYFTISLNKSNQIYYSGEKINGTVRLKCFERLKIKSISVLLKGEANVAWKIDKLKGKSWIEYVKSKEKYLNKELPILNKRDDSDIYIEPGEHLYQFETSLPEGMPTSFEHQYGRIRYFIKARLEIPWAFDKETIRTFSVVYPYDLNANSNLKLALGTSDKKQFCCGPCKSQPIEAKFNISKGGFVPGEKIICNAFLDNKSSRQVEQIKITLYQRMKFSAKDKSKILVRNISSVSNQSVIGEKKLEKWENVALKIPPVCTTTKGTCKIIDISYEVRLSYKVSGVSLPDTDLCIPIIIGTIPTFSDEILYPSKNYPISFEFSSLNSEPFVDEASERGTNNAEIIENDSINFRPLYPFYTDN